MQNDKKKIKENGNISICSMPRQHKTNPIREEVTMCQPTARKGQIFIPTEEAKKVAKRISKSVYIHFLHREGHLYLLRIGPMSSESL